MSPCPEIKKPMPIMTPLRKANKIGEIQVGPVNPEDKTLLGHNLKSKVAHSKILTKSPAGKIRKFV